MKIVAWLVVACCGAVLFIFASSSGFAEAQSPAARAGSPIEPSSDVSAEALTAAACKQTVERFIEELDVVMTESPRSIRRYQAVLARHFYYRQWFPGMPPVAPDSSIVGCRVDEVMEAAKRSRFLHEIGRPPRYQHHRVEFRNGLAKVYFSIDPDSRNIFGADVAWIRFYP